MRAVVTGGTGLIGRELITQLNQPVLLSRSTASQNGAQVLAWQPEQEAAPLATAGQIDAVFHLAGEPVAGRWTADKKRRIADSRKLGTRNLVAGIASMTQKPKVLVSVSAVGYYGDRGDTELDEASDRGDGFLADVCADWEKEALAATAFGVRVVRVRIGVVLASGGGALAKMLPPFRVGLGGPLGNGKQWMPWVHIDDVVGILLHAAKTDAELGVLNAVAPHPVTNSEFTQALGQALHRPAFLPMPKLALHVLFGEMSEMLLGSQRVLPRRAERSGYQFHYTDLASALRDILHRPSESQAA